MFQRLTSVLFGDAAEDSSLCEAKLHLNEKEEDDEWILVDYLADADTDSCNNRVTKEPSQEVSNSDKQALYPYCSPLSMLEDPEDGSFLCTQEEGWIVTPPPCFTAGGDSPVLLETSPLENLLIEHPSMSVYALHSSHFPLRSGVCSQPTFRIESQKKRSHLPGCNPATLSVSINFFEQSKRRCIHQRVKHNIKRQQHSHNTLHRTNLLHESSTCQTKRNIVKLHQPEQRHFNY
ncbi:tumor protein p53-inducible nuclear protein 1-like [Arapaima gigas]